MSKQRNQVNVRLDDKTNEIVNRVAKANRVSKSEVVRLALTGELEKIDAKKNKSLSDEEREKVLRELGKMMGVLSNIQNQNARLGSNVNQIAKAINMGRAPVSTQDATAYATYGNAMSKGLESMGKGLDALWRILV